MNEINKIATGVMDAVAGKLSKTICIYHSKDMDGYCSGAIMKKRFPEAIMIGFDYGEDIFSKLHKAGFADKDKPLFPPNGFEGNIIMADVSMKMPDMQDLSNWCGNRFTWIDHHKSAIDEIAGGKQGIFDIDKFGRVVLVIGRAACELCWDYFFKAAYSGIKGRENVPEAVLYLGEYDTWRNSDKYRWDNLIMPFQYGMRLICTGLDDFPMDLLNPSEVFDPLYGPDPVRAQCADITRTGQTVLKYQKQMNKRACRAAFEVEFEELRAICLNNGGANSQLFDSVWNEEKYDIMMPFVYNGREWVFSIYTTKPDIDCSELAKRHGGGGHKQAAGFQVTDAHWFAETFLIFKK